MYGDMCVWILCIYMARPPCLPTHEGVHACEHVYTCLGLYTQMCRPICVCAYEHMHLKGLAGLGCRVCRRRGLRLSDSALYKAGGGVAIWLPPHQQWGWAAPHLGPRISPPPSSTQSRAQLPRNTWILARTLASITAEKKVPKSSAGWRQGRHQETKLPQARQREPLLHTQPHRTGPPAPSATRRPRQA